jgi:hypothetical protein
MLGLKIVMTGTMLMSLACIAIAIVGKKMPSLWLALPIMTAFFGGLGVVVGGFFCLIWC